MPPRPEAIGGGNPFEGLGRADDPNPSRAGDFPSLNTLPPDLPANDTAPPDPNLPQANGVIGNTPGAAEALKKAQELAKEEGKSTDEEKSFFDSDKKTDNAKTENTNSGEANFFKVVPDSPIRSTLVEIREGKYESALNHLSSMFARNPTAIEMQYLMAVSAVMLHRNTEAQAHYKKVLEYKLSPLRLRQMAQRGLDRLAVSSP